MPCPAVAILCSSHLAAPAMPQHRRAARTRVLYEIPTGPLDPLGELRHGVHGFGPRIPVGTGPAPEVQLKRAT